MTKSSEWRTLSEDPVNTSESKTDGNCETNTHISERKRSSKTKTHSRYIQDIVSFLKHEAVKKEEHKTVGSNHVVRVTLGGDSVLARKKTLKLAKDAAAKEMMIMIGLYIEGVLEVRMDGPDGAPVIPPVDVFTMQLHLPGGRFPPSYGARDMVASRCSAAC